MERMTEKEIIDIQYRAPETFSYAEIERMKRELEAFGKERGKPETTTLDDEAIAFIKDVWERGHVLQQERASTLWMKLNAAKRAAKRQPDTATVVKGLYAAEAEFAKWMRETGRYRPPETFASDMYLAFERTVGAAFSKYQSHLPIPAPDGEMVTAETIHQEQEAVRVAYLKHRIDGKPVEMPQAQNPADAVERCIHCEKDMSDFASACEDEIVCDDCNKEAQKPAEADKPTLPPDTGTKCKFCGAYDVCTPDCITNGGETDLRQKPAEKELSDGLRDIVDGKVFIGVSWLEPDNENLKIRTERSGITLSELQQCLGELARRQNEGSR